MHVESKPPNTALAYHERTKHRLDRYAAGPETLDWDAQPKAFRHYQGATRIALRLLSELAPADSAARALARPFSAGELSPTFEWTLSTLGVLLQTSLGITAWKSYGPDRWAVRANPSSGNLHPIEGYVIASGLTFLEDGIYHYDPEQHALELRARGPGSSTEQPALYIALTSVMWREAWKYGERAFRYCQLDAGHAVAALTIAGALLGAELWEETRISAHALGALLGLDRVENPVQDSELEEPELLLRVEFACQPERSRALVLPDPEALRYFGAASVVDAHPIYRWPVIGEVARATRASATTSMRARHHVPRPRETTNTPLGSTRSAQAVVLGRRSAQRFDSHYTLPAHDFYALLGALMPSEAPVWAVLQAEPAIDLLLLVHRVADLPSGLYVLPRRQGESSGLLAQLSRRFPSSVVASERTPLPLQRLCELEPKQLMRIARAVHCHQDIAASSCFAVGMIAALEPNVSQRPASYRDLFREAGLLGQLLYVQAEALGLRGTGIGCYFDDEVHELFDLQGSHYQSLYHFTVGRALDDPRIENGAAYPERARPTTTIPTSHTSPSDHADPEAGALQTFLAQYGFDPTDLNAPREHGLTPLMRAALLGRCDLVEQLLARSVDLHARNVDGNNALWLGCVSNQPSVVTRLIDSGIPLNNQNDTGATTLMYAASSGKGALVALLLEAGADAYICNQDGAKAVDMAATLESLKLLRHTAT
jgi:SagB-type dehydrogenase family enzyme